MWIYIIIACFLILSELTYFKVADYFDIIDKPNERSSHSRITLRGGGIIFFIGILFFFLLFGFQYQMFFIGLTIITLISFLDDILTVPSRYRLVVHFIAILLMFADCGINDIQWYYIIVALIVATGIINAYNFMDGINGMTGGYSMIAVTSFWYINNHIHSFIDNDLLYVIGISLIVFIFFNFRNKAKCFAGDVGSFSIAFIIVFLLAKLIIETQDLTYIIILLIYGVDAILTITHRLILKENIFKAHRKHMYQIMSNELHIPHTYVSAIYMLAQTIVMIGYFFCKISSVQYFFSFATIMAIIYIFFMQKYFKRHYIKK